MPNYAAMTFPPYKYVEYPKVIRVDGKEIGIAQSQSEELRMLSDPPTSEPSPIVAERDALAQSNAELSAKLAALQAKFDKGPEQKAKA